PEPAVVRRRRLQEQWGFSDTEMRDIVNVGALDVIEATISAGSSPANARKWWLGELARIAAERDITLADLPVTPQHITELSALIDSGRITDKIAREVLTGVLAGEGSPEEVVDARGLEVVSDDAELLAHIDEALAA